MSQLVFNIERASIGTLRAQGKHDQRTAGNLTHVCASRTPLNRTLKGTGDPVADCEAVIQAHGARIRKDVEEPFVRFVLSASPSHFKAPQGLSPAQAEAYEAQRLKDFVKRSGAFLKKHYGAGLAYAVLHLDEATPHIHAVAVPLVSTSTKKGERTWVSHSTHPATKGRDSYARLRADAAATLGLGYGEPGGKPKAQAEAQAKASEAKAAAKLQELQRREDRLMVAELSVARERRAAAVALAAAREALAKQGRTSEAEQMRDLRRSLDRSR